MAHRFLLAKLHLDSLAGKKSVKALRNALNQLATGSDAYDRAYEAAMERIDGQVADQADLAKQTLAFLSCARSRLGTDELQEALGVEVGEPELDSDNFPDIEDAVAACLGLVIVDSGTGFLRLVHYTTQEYLARTQHRWFPRAHDMITDVCATYLSFDAFGQPNEWYLDNDADVLVRAKHLYWYAARHWGHHASLAPEACEQVSRFLSLPFNILALHKLQWSYEDRKNPYRDTRGHKIPLGTQGIHVAAQYGLVIPLTALLDEHRNPDIVDLYPKMSIRDDSPTDRVTPLLVAARHRQKNIMEILLRRNADVNYVSEGGNSVLLYASHYGDTEIVRFLIKNGANWGPQDAYVEEVILVSDHTEWFLASYGDIRELRHIRESPLLVAAFKGHTAVVELFISGEANYRITPGDAGASLIAAAWFGHLSIVEIILEADARTRTMKLHHYGDYSVDEPLRIPTPDTLASSSLGLRLRESDKNDALMFAATKGRDDIARLILDNVAETKLDDNEGSKRFTEAPPLKIPPFIMTVRGFGENMDSMDEHGHTVLSRAAVEGWVPLIELLILYGADVTCPTPPRRNPLTEAVKRWTALSQRDRHYRDIATKLSDPPSESPSLDNLPSIGDTAKPYATIAECLLSAGACLTPVDSAEQVKATIKTTHDTDTSGLITLTVSAEKQGATDLSLRPDALVNFERENNAFTILDIEPHYQPTVAQHLINCGAELDAVSKKGNTPLHVACQWGNPKLVALYLANNANTEARNRRGRTPLIEACSSSWLDLETIKLLLEKGVDVNKQDARGQTALFHIDPEVHQGVEVAKLLLKAGADVNHRDKEGRTPLFFAAQRHAVDFVALYLRHGANAIARTKAGQTALTIVCGQQCPQKDYLRSRYNQAVRLVYVHTRRMSI